MEKIPATTPYIVQICSDIVIKCVAVFAGIAVNFTFGDISHSLLSAIMMLIVFDFITALFATRVTKEKITSAKTFRTAWKFTLYFMVISAAYFTELVIGTDLFIAKTVMIFLAVTELVSILENVEKIGYPMPTKLYKELKNILKNK